MSALSGNVQGLKSGQIQRLTNLYRRRVPPEFIITPELARDTARLSHEIMRQIGLLINRAGRIISVIVGDAHGILIPDTPEYRTLPGRLKGLRCVHTRLPGRPGGLSDDDLTDLALLRLDFMGVLELMDSGDVRRLHAAHILPDRDGDSPWRLLDPVSAGDLDMDCASRIRALEDELAHIRSLYTSEKGQERAILVSISTRPRSEALDSLDELAELAGSGRIHVVDTVLQLRRKADPRFLMGRGKLRELALSALRHGVSMIVFDQDLNPGQLRSITDQLDLKIIDRTQLILDIFAQRAKSREGKLQVELAQLNYLLPRLITKNTAMSRLTGGIGGRGPGETRLEINRRRVRERIHQLEKNLKTVVRQRRQQKARRNRRGLPVISIVGYTNAGKSTLLNTLTQSAVRAEDRLFATLDPASRRLRFPRDIDVIITDTVGFIRDLPKDLTAAFRATLEELESADILLHVMDAGNPRLMEQMRSVEQILTELRLDRIPQVRVLNKMDTVSAEKMEALARQISGIPASALSRPSLAPLVSHLSDILEKNGRFSSEEA